MAYASAVSVLSDLEVAAEHQELHDISEMEAVGRTVLPRSQTCDRGPCVHVYYNKTFTRDMCSAYCRGVSIQIKRVAGPAGERVQARIVKAPAGDVRWRQEFFQFESYIFDRKVRTHHAIYELSESVFVTVFVMFWF